MISKNDAIKLAKAVVISLKEEEAHPNLQGRNNKARYAARGAASQCGLWTCVPY